MSRKYFDRVSAGTGVSGRKFECDFGLKVLKKFGWSEGKGLGAQEDGRADCVQIKKREKQLGLGCDGAPAAETQWEDWWKDAFNSAAKKVKADGGNSCDSSNHGDDSAPAKPSGRTTAVKSASRMKGKLARIRKQEGKAVASASDSDSDSDRDSDSTSSDSASVGLSAWVAKVAAKRREKELHAKAPGGDEAPAATGGGDASRKRRGGAQADEADEKGAHSSVEEGSVKREAVKESKKTKKRRADAETE